MGRCLASDPNDVKLFNENLTNFTRSIGRALEYYNDYEFFLNDYLSSVKELESTFNEYTEVGRSLAGTRLDDKGRKTLESYINKLYELSSKVADCYIRNI